MEVGKKEGGREEKDRIYSNYFLLYSLTTRINDQPLNEFRVDE